jgi:peptidoglycan/LPS O-acetylase OafA/YrhL
VIMLGTIVFVPWFPAISASRTLFMLFILRPILHLSIAGVVLHVIQTPYHALNWAPGAWIGEISYSLYLWQELFCSNSGLHQGYLLAVMALDVPVYRIIALSSRCYGYETIVPKRPEREYFSAPRPR